MKAAGFSKDSLSSNSAPSAWIAFEQPGRVCVRSGKVEFGQGINTALLQIAADSLGVDVNCVTLAPVRTDSSPNEGVTSGSLSIQHSGRAIELVCRELRARARRYACEHFGEVQGFQDGQFKCRDGTASYWSIPTAYLFGFDAGGLAGGDAEPAPPHENLPRRDLRSKVFGKPSYIHDLKFDDVLHGRVIRASGPMSPEKAAQVTLPASLAGVRLLRNGAFLGVLADTEWAVVRAAERLATQVDSDRAEAEPSAHEDLADWLERGEYQTTMVAESRSADRPNLHREFSGSYFRPYIAHASIAPSCAIAWWRDNRLDVWTHSQGVFNLRDDILIWLAREHPDFPAQNLVVHHAEGAGCYGHNPADDVAFDAVLLAEHAGGRPVRVVNSRADELRQGPFGPCHLVKLTVGTDSDGRICEWAHSHFANGYTLRPGRSGSGNPSFLAATEIEPPFAKLVSLDPPPWVGGGSDRNADPIYRIPTRTIVANRLLTMPIRTSALRSLGGFANVFGIESMMDEIALAYGRDPIAYRLEHLDDARACDVIEAAVAGAAWWYEPHDEGTGHGFGFARYKNTGAWCAIAARIEADDRIRLTDLSIAVDVGRVINRDGVANQIEGGAIQGASWALNEEVRIRDGKVESVSWDTYPILGFDAVPHITLTVIDRPDQAPLGAGEASQGPVAAAIGNAVRDALGVRVRSLPITYDRVMAELLSLT